jgi:terminase large subunit-like protein
MTLRLDKAALFKHLGYEPHPGQRLVHESKAPRRVLACGVRWGKSVCAAMEAVAAALEPKERSIGWIVAPTLDLADKVFREVQIVLAEKLPHRVIELKQHEKRILVRNLGGGTSEIRAKTADNPVSLLGEGLDWLIVDEAARLRPAIWSSYLSQRLIDKKGWALLISTPRGKGWFYDLWRRGQANQDGYCSWNAPSWENLLLDRDLIEAQRLQVPERVFRQEYGAEFMEGAGAVFRNVRELATGDLRPPEPGEKYWAGLDLAKVEDFTVLIILNARREVCHVDRVHRLDWSLQVNRIRAALERYNNARVLVDSTGVGEPIYESLRAAGCRAFPYALTSRSKAALVDSLSLLLEQKQIVLPRAELCPELLEELEAFEYSVTDAGTVKTGAPGGVHDDAVIALALAAFELGPARPKPATLQVRPIFS